MNYLIAKLIIGITILLTVNFCNGLLDLQNTLDIRILGPPRVQRQTLEDYRLPNVIKPTNYIIEITPYLEAELPLKQQFTFDGHCQITLNAVVENVTEIKLHLKNLEIISSKLHEVNDANSIINITENSHYNNITEIYTFDLETPLKLTTSYLIIFNYTGYIMENLDGFYRSSYYDYTLKVKKTMAVTQLGLTAARRVFPCFDEPHFKATFVIKINRLNHFPASLSNAEMATESVVGVARTQDVFAQTPNMSTYLVAFIVSEFQGSENENKHFGVFARPEALSQTVYGLNYGQRSLAKFNEWFQLIYETNGIDKMHLIAIPDFSFGAMENWGIMTFRETALLYDEHQSNALSQQRVASIISHEQAHMWFGNLVTCDWWSYAWLNEGFARYFQYVITDLLEPTWELNLQFTVDVIQSTFAIDATESVQPMTNLNINSPSEVLGMFNSITYNKGASIIRMIEHLIGTNNMQLALREYLRTNQFNTSTPEKLYYSLQEQVNSAPMITIKYNITEIMNTWTLQSGYPVVMVNVQANRKDILITQSRFLLQKGSGGIDADEKWDIPINYATNLQNDFDSTFTEFILSKNQNDPYVLNLEFEIDWIILNKQQTGYYRVNYDPATWSKIEKALKYANHSSIHVLNRAQIIDDVMNLARANIIDYPSALSIFQYLENEEHYTPWLAGFNAWRFISDRFILNDLKLARKYILDLTKNIYQKLGFIAETTDSRLNIYNRMNVLSYLCKFGHTECISKSKEMFNEFMQNNISVPVDIRPAVYCTAIREGSQIEWDFLWYAMLLENVASEQIVMLNALGCTSDAERIKDYILKIVQSDGVRQQDKTEAFTSIYSQYPENVQIVYDHVIENYKDLSVWGGLTNIENILVSLAEKFTTIDQINRLEQFRNTNVEFQASIRLRNAIENANNNILWAEQNMPIINKYMNEVSGSSTITSICLLIILKLFIVYVL